MKQFVEYEDPYADLSEIGQRGSLRMAFATMTGNESYETQHLFVKCRDFLNDAVIGSHGSYETPEIYGFKFDGENNPIDRDKTRLILRVDEATEEYKNFRSNLKKFNDMISESNMERTRAWVCERKGGSMGCKYVLVEGDSRWVDHVTAMSFYSLMLRTLTTSKVPEDMSYADYLKNKDYHSYNDNQYLEDFNEAFEHPKDFISKMELLDMSAVHRSIEELDEMEPAHERGGIQVFSQLVLAFRRGASSVRSRICEFDYNYDDDDDFDDLLKEAVYQFPTINDARNYV